MKKFTFNSSNYDFWPIYKAIREYYPIGIDKDSANAFSDFSGTQKKEKLLIEKIHNQENFEDYWVAFCKDLQQEIGLEVVGTTGGQAPSFSGYILLSKKDFPSVVHTKELHFAVSLLGPFYKLYGKDNIMVLEDGIPVNSPKTNLLTCSPVGDYKNVFLQVDQIIKRQFEGFRLVPFFMLNFILEGLQIPYCESKLGTVNQALFNDFLASCNDVNIRKGQGYYGLEAWQNKGINKEGGVIF